MAEAQNPPSQPPQPAQPPSNQKPASPPAQQPPQPPSGPPSKNMNQKSPTNNPLLIALFMFILGIIGGILLFITYPRLNPPPDKQPAIQKEEIFLPKDAIQTADCVDNKGTLYTRPQDMHQGPVYMVYKNKIIGIEYQIDRDEFFEGKAYKNLPTFNIKVDHMNVKFIATGEGGLKNQPLIDLYLVDAKTEQAIICNKPVSPTPEASPSASITITHPPSIPVSIKLSPQPTNQPFSPASTL